MTNMKIHERMLNIIAVVQLLNHIWLFVTSWTAAHRASLSFTVSLNLLKLMSVELVMPSSHFILCHPLLLLPSIFPIIRLFQRVGCFLQMARWYWSFSFSISPSNEYSGLISYRIDWFDFPAVQETLKSLLQHQSSKASILWHSAFFMSQISHPHITWAFNNLMPTESAKVLGLIRGV